MNKIVKLSAVLFVVAVSASLASASTINSWVMHLYENAAYNDYLDDGDTLMLICDDDMDNDTNSSPESWEKYHNTIGKDSFLADPEDVILDAWGLSGVIGGTAYDGGDEHAANWDNGGKGVDEGDHFALFWFDLPFSDITDINNGPGKAGIAYGYYRTDDVLGGVFGGNLSYEVPANNVSDDLRSITQNAHSSGDIPDSEMAAEFETVPEPMTIALLAGGGIFVTLRRRKNS